MEQEKRALLAVALCLLALLAWPYITGAIQGKTPPGKNAQVQAPADGKTPPATAAAATPTGAPADAAAQPGAAPAVAPAQPVIAPEQRIVVEQPGFYRAELTSYGAALAGYELLDHKYWSRDRRKLTLGPGQSSPRVDVQTTDGPTNLVAGYRPALLTRFTSGFEQPKLPAYTLVSDSMEGASRKIVYALETAEYRLEKTFIFSPKSYEIPITVSLTNKKNAPVNYHLEVGVEGFQDPTQKPGGTFSARVPQNEAAWDRAKKYFHVDLEGLRGGKADSDDLRGDVRWIGIGQQYFLFAAGLPRGAKIGDKQGRATAEDNGEISMTAEFAEHTLQPNETRLYPFQVYGGPKMPRLLDGVSLEGQTVGLSTAIDYTLESLARPMLWVMQQMYLLTHNWAIAIILLTLLVKLILLYPSHRSMQSMKAMGQLKPQIEALKERCGDDKQKFNEEMMALYRKHNINPVGGCLPILLQMPIYFALYSMLGNAVELYRVKLFWIPDLTAADPYFVLPLVTGALMYVQSKFLSPAPVDPQQKMMVTMMPVMFTVFTVFVPAGLTLYIMTNTVLGMVQQAVVNRGQTPAPAVAVIDKPRPRNSNKSDRS